MALEKYKACDRDLIELLLGPAIDQKKRDLTTNLDLTTDGLSSLALKASLQLLTMFEMDLKAYNHRFSGLNLEQLIDAADLYLTNPTDPGNRKRATNNN